MLVVGVVLGRKAERAHRQHKAVRWVVAHGGTVEYAHQKRDAVGYLLPSQPLGLKWLRHDDLLDANVSDLSPLRDLKTLQTLRFRGGQVSDLSPLKQSTHVPFFVWHGGKVTVPKTLEGRVVWQL